MARLLDQILVVDVESTCWDNEPPAGQMNEIIEIGICPVDVRNMSRLERRSILVRPEKSEISPFCTELTTLTAAQLSSGVSFAEACRRLTRDFKSKDRVWASWGDYDRIQFERCCQAFQVPYPFGRTHLNVKSLFSLLEGQTREQGLADAYQHLGWTLEGTHHRGHDDAWNIAGIFCEIGRRQRMSKG